jgi:hypothetical protein
MLWHVNQAMDLALGNATASPEKVPLPRALLKFAVIHLPWMKGAPTTPMLQATGDHDFRAEQRRCLRLIDEFAAKPLDGEWPPSPVLGRMSGRDASRLHAKHLNHHLRQFGV